MGKVSLKRGIPRSVTRAPAQSAPTRTARRRPGRSSAPRNVHPDQYVAPKSGAGVPERNYVGRDYRRFKTFNQREVAPGNPNACGTTSLSMVLRNEGLLGSLDDARALDKKVRSWGGFSAPRDLMQHAESRGLGTSALNRSSFGELEERLAAGNQVMCMVNSGSNPHWVVALGTYDGADGERRLKIANPSGGEIQDLSQSEFERMWKRPMAGTSGLLNDVMGYENYMIALDRDGAKLPPSRDHSVTNTDTMADGVSDVANAIANRDLSSIGDALSGVVKVLSGLPGALGQVGAALGERLSDWGARQWQEGGLLGKLGGGLSWLNGKAIEGVGDLISGAGAPLSDIGSAVGGVFKKLF